MPDVCQIVLSFGDLKISKIQSFLFSLVGVIVMEADSCGHNIHQQGAIRDLCCVEQES